MVFIQLCLLIFFSTFVLGVEWGAYTSVLILSLFTAFAVAGLGILLAAVTFVSDKTRIASLFESVIFQIMGLLGGAYIPLEVLPEEMRLLSKMPLNGVALDGYLKIMAGSPVAEISSNMLLLTVNGLVLSGVAIYLVRSKEAKKHDGNHQAQASRA
jgi:ABC-type multidrug transport system permease subunit